MVKRMKMKKKTSAEKFFLCICKSHAMLHFFYYGKKGKIFLPRMCSFFCALDENENFFSSVKLHTHTLTSLSARRTKTTTEEKKKKQTEIKGKIINEI
jgi:hypothetical protein